MPLRTNLDDYIVFFEAEPIETHVDGWFYGIRFAVSRDDDELNISIAPDNLTFDLEWKQQGRRRLTLNLKMVAGWEIEKRDADEYLLLRINTGPEALCAFDYCIVRLKPSIEVNLCMSWGSGWDPNEER